MATLNTNTGNFPKSSSITYSARPPTSKTCVGFNANCRMTEPRQNPKEQKDHENQFQIRNPKSEIRNCPGLYTDRTAGRDRHHRDSGLAAVARAQQRQGSGEADQMPEQPKANRPRLHVVSRRQ